MSRVHRVLTDDEVKKGAQTRWTELEIHGRVVNLSPSLWNIKHLTALFLNNNQLISIPPEIAQLTNLTLLDLSNNRLKKLPSELGDMISLCNLYLNNNQIRTLPYELGKLFRLQNLGLRGNPLQPELYKLYQENHVKLLKFLLDHVALSTAPPPDRNWVMIRHADPDRPIATFTVLCYNVLCDKYATANLYSYCPTWALNWEYRKMSIIKEIRNYEADIITLQEVETEQYNMLFKPELSALGYESIFSPKSRAKTMNEEDRKYVDGCAIFWKRDKFEMEREHLIEFTQVAIKRAQNSDAMLNRVMPKDNIALCAVLRIKDQVYNNRRHVLSAADNVVDSPLVVCTAHIHWDPEFCDVKLVQTMMLVDELWKLVENVAAKFRITPQQTPCLVCGDLNSLPDSGVFEFLSRGQISRQHGDLKGFREDTCLEKFTAHKDDRQNFTHSLRLDSAVDQTSVQFTNYTLDFKGMIDYIFSTPQSLARLGVLGAFDLNWVHHNKIIGFPHPHVPSDHIPIMAQYAIIPTGHQRALTSQSQTSQSQQQTPIGGGYSR